MGNIGEETSDGILFQLAFFLTFDCAPAVTIHRVLRAQCVHSRSVIKFGSPLDGLELLKGASSATERKPATEFYSNSLSFCTVCTRCCVRAAFNSVGDFTYWHRLGYVAVSVSPDDIAEHQKYHASELESTMLPPVFPAPGARPPGPAAEYVMFAGPSPVVATAAETSNTRFGTGAPLHHPFRPVYQVPCSFG